MQTHYQTPMSPSRLLCFQGLWRSITNREAMNEERPLPYYGVSVRPSLFELNPGSLTSLIDRTLGESLNVWTACRV